ncbi:DUF2516 family protein [Spongiactinospora sp. TRM90649]|uniref:DUF2516 family protein n=1 Tax=Spongiactinospora sp. TRM90649 TaxID=3031114 RepID=UPI0023F9B75B|nr:DUF2516 family protein [Spongiactinospora sp. TRM90649]MDF5751725.1 DUF2516 family protein [Spongiactinospora sp. TRM90649]
MVFGVLDLIYWVLGVAAFGMSGFALIHAIRTPARAFAITGKQSKQLWLIILAFSTLFAFSAAVQYLPVLGILTIISVIASGIYLADVRPAVREIGKGGNSGPYGPW